MKQTFASKATWNQYIHANQRNLSVLSASCQKTSAFLLVVYGEIIDLTCLEEIIFITNELTASCA